MPYAIAHKHVELFCDELRPRLEDDDEAFSNWLFNIWAVQALTCTRRYDAPPSAPYAPCCPALAISAPSAPPLRVARMSWLACPGWHVRVPARAVAPRSVPALTPPALTPPALTLLRSCAAAAPFAPPPHLDAGSFPVCVWVPVSPLRLRLPTG